MNKSQEKSNIADYTNKTVLYLIFIMGKKHKFGVSDKLDDRLTTHKRELNYKKIVKLWIIDNMTDAKKQKQI